ncbi:MAG TPA: CU044_5270 family protein [Pseudonocardiaceae bacterium]|jgi:hypothetical protein
MREKNRKALEALARARPDALDPTRLADSARQRQNLIELMSAQPARSSRRRVLARRRVLVPAVGLAAAAAVAVGAVAVGVGQDRGTQAAADPDGHLMLLTMAQSVQNQAISGNYWQYQTQSQTLSLIRPTKLGTQPYVVADTAQANWSIGVKPGEQSLMISQLNDKRGPWTAEDTHRWLMVGSPTTVLVDNGYSTDARDSLAMTIGGGQPIVNRENFGDKIAAVGPDNVNFDYLRSLPSDQTELAQTFAQLYGKSESKGVDEQANWMFTQVSGLITLPVSNGTRAAAYRVLADLPGITSLGTVTDPLGRTGVAVALPPTEAGDLGKQQQQLVVDPGTNTILSQQTVLVSPSPLAIDAGLKAGTILNYTATTHIGWTDQQVALPTTP